MAKKIRQILAISVFMAFVATLFLISYSQARNGHEKASTIVTPIAAMQILALPNGKLIDKCLAPDEIPQVESCNPFIRVDEEVLQDLIQNYPKCLNDASSYYYNFSNQGEIKISEPLEIYGRTSEPLTISGLKLAPEKIFPKDLPAIIVHGENVEIKNFELNGFTTGVLFVSENNETNKLVGGTIRKAGEEEAILTCTNSPLITNVEIVTN